LGVFLNALKSGYLNGCERARNSIIGRGEEESGLAQ